MSRIRVLLVDDHTLVRQGMRRMLEIDREVEVVGECGDGRRS
jgi:DNA-binding NarL/FixJ family response regulator